MRRGQRTFRPDLHKEADPTYLFLGDTLASSSHSIMISRGKLLCRKLARYHFSRFDRTPTSDGHTSGHSMRYVYTLHMRRAVKTSPFCRASMMTAAGNRSPYEESKRCLRCSAICDGSLAIPDKLIICPIAVAYSMGQIKKSFCVCPCMRVCMCVRLWTLSRSHFFVDFHQIGHRRVNPQK